jgi:hypothetical protein
MRLLASGPDYQGVRNKAGVQEIVVRYRLAINSKRFSFSLADLLYVPCSAVLEFGVILVFPGPARFLKRIEHPQPPELFPGHIGKEATVGAFGDERINLFRRLLGDYDVGSLTHSVSLR